MRRLTPKQAAWLHKRTFYHRYNSPWYVLGAPSRYETHGPAFRLAIKELTDGELWNGKPIDGLVTIEAEREKAVDEVTVKSGDKELCNYACRWWDEGMLTESGVLRCGRADFDGEICPTGRWRWDEAC